MIASLIVATLLSQSTRSMYFPWSGGFSRGDLDRADVVAVVTVKGDSVRQTRQEVVRADPKSPPRMLGDAVMVESTDAEIAGGKGVHRGDRVKLVHPVLDGLPDGLSLVPGRRYLVVAFKPTGDHLTFPPPMLLAPATHYIEGIEPDDWRVQLDDKSELAAVLAFPTEEQSLPEKPEVSQILLSIVKSLNPSDDDSYRRVLAALNYAWPKLSKRPPVDGIGPEVEYAKPDEVAKALQDAMKPASDYQRSKIWELLLSWLVPGSKVGYVRCLENLANDTSHYRVGTDEQLFNDWDVWSHLESFPRIPDDKWMDLVMRSTNDRIAVFFLFWYGVHLDMNGQRLLASRLLDPDLQIRAAVARRLSLINRDPKHSAFLYASPQELAPIVEYWKKFYDIRSDGG